MVTTMETLILIGCWALGDIDGKVIINGKVYHQRAQVDYWNSLYP